MSNENGYRRLTLVSVCWMVLMATIVVIVAFCHFPDGADWKWCIPLEGRYHIPMMLCGAVAFFLVAFVCKQCCRNEKINRGRIATITAMLTVIQTVMVYNYYVFTDWDVQQVTGLAQAMAEGRPTDDFREYFQIAPNNLFLTRVFALIFFVTGPIWGLKTSLFPLIALQSIGAGLTAIMLFQTAMHIWEKKSYAVIAYIIYLVLVWFSPWWSIPYSDVWGLMVSVALLWLATTLPFRRGWLKLLIIGVVTVLGYYIRPQIVFVPLSLGLVCLLKGRNFKKLLSQTGLMAGGIVVGILIAHLAVAGSGMHLHTSKGFGATHYLMMGANYQSIGIYSAQDVDFSKSLPKKKERQRAELDEMWRRYKALELDGTLLLWGRKNLLNFSDGTFYWGREGSFYKIVPERSNWISRITRNVFYNRGLKGSCNDAWSIVMTSLWFGVLFFTFIAAWPRRRKAEIHTLQREDRKIEIDAMMLSVMLLTLFHTLSEARARYLFCFAPLFILVAVEGVKRLFSIV